jgi:hypothetical protein
LKKLIVEISDELNDEFRKVVYKRFGFKKGAIKKALYEVLNDWIALQKRHMK